MSKSKQGNLSIPWPFEKMEVASNTDTNLLKIIAMLSMLIDHMGAAIFPQYRIMRIIGRLAFPIYAYCLAVGCIYTHDMLKYVKRVALIALISQPIYALALHPNVLRLSELSFSADPVGAAVQFYLNSWGDPSILLSLFCGLIFLWTLRDRHLVLTAGMVIFAALFYRQLCGILDYGIRGIVLMLLFFLFAQTRWVSLLVVGGYMLWWGLQGAGYSAFGIRFSSQMFAIFALFLIYIRTNSRIKLNKWIFYLFYPAHLILIYVLDKLAVFA